MALNDDHPIRITYKWAKRIVVSVVGFTVLLVGLAMTVLPGPAFLVIPIGLGILGLEFAWARRWLHKVKDKTQQLAATLVNNGTRRNGGAAASASAAAQRAAAGGAAPNAASDRARNSS